MPSPLAYLVQDETRLQSEHAWSENASGIFGAALHADGALADAAGVVGARVARAVLRAAAIHHVHRELRRALQQALGRGVGDGLGGGGGDHGVGGGARDAGVDKQVTCEQHTPLRQRASTCTPPAQR